MLNGLYGSAASLDSLSKLQEATASNLAHLNTPGHRRLVSAFSEMIDPGQSGEARPGSNLDRKTADFSAGRFENTGRHLDLSLNGDAFFAYQGANGPMYSRNGVVFRNPENNQLVNSDGFPLLDENNSPVTYEGAESDLTISSNGSISANGQQLGKVGVFSFNDNRLLESENQTYFRAGGAVAQPATDFILMQGSRELSNASPVTELISLIVCSRHYEASQRVLRTISDAMQENTRS